MVTSPLETTGSNGCKVIRAGTGTRETNSPHNYGRGYLRPLPPPPWSIFLSGLIGVIGHGIFIATVARDFFTRASVHGVDDNIDTRHTFTPGVQFDHDLETIVPFFRYDLQRHRCVVDSHSLPPSPPPVVSKRGGVGGEGGRGRTERR